MDNMISSIITTFGALAIGYLLGYLHAILNEDEHRKRRILEERIERLEAKQ